MANYSMTLKGPLKNRSVIFLTTQKTWNYKLFMVVEHLMLAIHWLVSVLQAWWHFFFFNLKWFTSILKHFYQNLCMQESHPLLKLHEVPTTDSSQVRWVQVQVHRGVAEVYLNLDEAYLSWSCMRRKASTPRRSRGVLAFLRVQLQRNVDEEGGKYTEE